MSLDVRDLYFGYEEKESPFLEDFQMSLNKGNIIALTGRNGCGKTTLGKLIMGILKPWNGGIFLDEKNVTELSLAERGRRIGYLMQNSSRQIISMTVMEEVEYGLKNMGLQPEKVSRKAMDFLKYFDLEGESQTFPHLLSQGEKQRLVLAAILSMEPGYMFLDEPTSGLDYKRKAKLGEYLVNIKREMGTGILVASHDRDFIERYADDCVEMEAS